MNTSLPPGQWPTVARNWRLIGPPLRPVDADLAYCAEAIAEWRSLNETRAPRVQILGVTPEYVSLPWPAATQLQALDCTPAMIEHVWPGPKDAALFGRWEELNACAESLDFVLCDGGLHLLEFPQRQSQLVKRLTDALRPGGYCIFRLFSLPDSPETPEQVISALFQGEIPNLNVLKLRLGMAMQASPEAGTCLNDVYNKVAGLAANLPALAERLRWSAEHLGAIEGYRNSAARYHFLREDAAIRLFAEASGHALSLHRIVRPDYLLGERCATVIFKKI